MEDKYYKIGLTKDQIEAVIQWYESYCKDGLNDENDDETYAKFNAARIMAKSNV